MGVLTKRLNTPSQYFTTSCLVGKNSSVKIMNPIGGAGVLKGRARHIISHQTAPSLYLLLSSAWIFSDVSGRSKIRTPTASAIALATAAAVGTLGISPIAFP